MPETAQTSNFPASPTTTKVYASAYGRFSALTSKPVLMVLTALVFTAVGFASALIYQSSQGYVSKAELQKISPLSIETLSNRIFYDWRGTLAGTIIAIDPNDSTLTVKDRTYLLVVKLKKGAIMYDATHLDSRTITFKDFKVGSFIRAQVSPPIVGTGLSDYVVRDIGIFNK